MNYRIGLYSGLLAIGLLSFFGALLLPANEITKTLTALPFVGALFAGLFQILRDHSSFQHDALLQQREHAFVVSATSHMSCVVFDKHVAFAEEYVEALMKILGDLFSRGPNDDFTIVDPLHGIRRKYRLWVSTHMAASLDHFESQLVDMAAEKGMAKATGDTLDKDNYKKAYDLFREILNLAQKGDMGREFEEKKQRGYALVIANLQKALGVEELTRLRDEVLASAAKK